MRSTGHTLIELTVSLAILGILMTAMASAVAIASRAIPAPDSAAAATQRADAALERLASDLTYAMEFTQPLVPGTGRLAFTVADRDGDGNPEHIEYTWSGAAGDPLMRRYNDAEPSIIAGDVHAFDIVTQTNTVTESYAGPIVEETSDRVVSAAIAASASSESTHELRTDHWIGQRFELQGVPPGAIGWKPVEVIIKGAPGNSGPLDQATDVARLRIYDLGSNFLPAGTALSSGTLLESALALNSMPPVAMSSSSLLAVDKPYALVVAYDGALAGTMRVQYASSDAAGLLTSTGGASVWTLHEDQGLLHQIKGRFWVRQPDQAIERTYITGLEVALACGPDGQTRRTAVAPLNMPEVVSALWRCDFTTDPRRLDINADGVADWSVRSGLTLSPANLLDGLLRWQGTLDARPAFNFDRPTTIDARFKTTSSSGAEIRFNPDADGGAVASLTLRLRHDSGGQVLELRQETSSLAQETLTTVPDLGDGFVRARLVLDPVRDTINLAVNGQYVETFTYSRSSMLPAPEDAAFSIVTNADSTWDWVDVRVGGESR